MTKLSLLGAVAILACAATAAPAIAQHRATHIANPATEGDWCANREPGNPYTKEEDYMAWSAWRARGSWDDRNDFKCVPRRLSHSGF